MDLVRARADGEVDGGAAEDAELRGRVVGLDLELLDGLERRRDVDVGVLRLVVDDAVEQVVVARPGHAVDGVRGGDARAGAEEFSAESPRP